MSRPIAAAALATLTLVSLVSPAARAALTKQECVKANADAQYLAMDGKLTAARKELDACSDPSCPYLVYADCVARAREVEAREPTVVFEVRDASGVVVEAVDVQVDGRPLTGRLDGTPLPVDPHLHVFTFTIPGSAPVIRSFFLGEGEKGRREQVVLPTTLAVTGEAARAADGPPATRTGFPPLRIAGLVVGGVGLATLVTGVVFGTLTFAAASEEKSACASASACADRSAAVTEHAAGVTDATAATTALVAGPLLLAGGAALFFMAPSLSQRGSPSGTAWTVSPLFGSAAGLSLSARF